MKKKKILVCFGTRPEAIKMCSLVHELKKDDSFITKVCVTAQHREMLDQVLDFFEIVPDYDLDIMKHNQTLNELSGRIFMKIDSVLEKEKPDLTLVHGDTTTSTISAWASFNRGVKVGHVEAGLRTYDKQSPFPEEVNRQLTGKIADFHFAPTELSENNLKSEKVLEKDIEVTGNTVIDSLFWTVNKLENGFSNDIIQNLQKKIDFNKKVLLVTAHRRENFGDGIDNISKALISIAKSNDVEIIFPVHLNPKVQKPINELLGNIKNIHLISPLDYPTFVWVMMHSYIIISDSGGIQEEAPSLGKPVLVMRDTTERPEAVTKGTVILVGSKEELIVKTANELIKNKSMYTKMTKLHNPYGDGNANARIVKFIKNKIL